MPRDNPPYTLLNKYIPRNAELLIISPYWLPTIYKGKEV
jgi:hypothetical protein